MSLHTSTGFSFSMAGIINVLFFQQSTVFCHISDTSQAHRRHIVWRYSREFYNHYGWRFALRIWHGYLFYTSPVLYGQTSRWPFTIPRSLKNQFFNEFIFHFDAIPTASAKFAWSFHLAHTWRKYMPLLLAIPWQTRLLWLSQFVMIVKVTNRILMV